MLAGKGPVKFLLPKPTENVVFFILVSFLLESILPFPFADGSESSEKTERDRASVFCYTVSLTFFFVLVNSLTKSRKVFSIK